MATPSPSGGGTGSFGLQPESVPGGNNSLTQYERSLSNLLGGSGAGLEQSGTKAVSAPIDYWMSILAGKPSAVTGAAEPDILATKSQYQQARRTVDQYSPMGGGRANAITSSRFAEASDIGKTLAGERSKAATSLAETGLSEQQLGIQQLGQAIQAVLSKMGLDIQGGTANTFNAIASGIGAII